MAHITLSLPEFVYREMKRHPEVKWSEVARQSIVLKLVTLDEINADDLLNSLPLVRESISRIDENEAKKLFKKMVKEERKHRKFLTLA